jgi:hypothetical protein
LEKSAPWLIIGGLIVIIISAIVHYTGPSAYWDQCTEDVPFVSTWHTQSELDEMWDDCSEGDGDGGEELWYGSIFSGLVGIGMLSLGGKFVGNDDDNAQNIGSNTQESGGWLARFFNKIGKAKGGGETTHPFQNNPQTILPPPVMPGAGTVATNSSSSSSEVVDEYGVRRRINNGQSEWWDGQRWRPMRHPHQ